MMDRQDKGIDRCGDLKAHLASDGPCIKLLRERPPARENEARA